MPKVLCGVTPPGSTVLALLSSPQNLNFSSMVHPFRILPILMLPNLFLRTMETWFLGTGAASGTPPTPFCPTRTSQGLSFSPAMGNSGSSSLSFWSSTPLLINTMAPQIPWWAWMMQGK